MDIEAQILVSLITFHEQFSALPETTSEIYLCDKIKSGRIVENNLEHEGFFAVGGGGCFLHIYKIYIYIYVQWKPWCVFFFFSNKENSFADVWCMFLMGLHSVTDLIYSNT